MGAGVGWALIFSPLLILLFVWLQVASKDNPSFLWLMYFSFFFVGLATLLLLHSDVGHAPKRLRRMFYCLTAITIAAIVGSAFSIASVPAGGTHDYFYFTPNNAKIDLEYGWTSSGNPGYSGRWEQKFLEVNYPIGAAWVFYELHGVHIYTEKNVFANVTFWFYLGFWPNRWDYRSIYQLEEGTATHNGTESLVSFEDSTFAIFWGSDNPESRSRLDRGFAVNMILDVEFEGPNYGDLEATIPLYSEVYVDYVRVSSQLQDGIAIFFCGIFAGALCYIPAKSIKPKIAVQFAPIWGRLNRYLTPETRGFLKKCIKCGREIPLASEECPHCGAKQP